MPTIQSKLTSKGQVSIPASVRRKLGLTPGSRVEWFLQDGEIVVRRASRYSSADIHAAIFESQPESLTAQAMNEGIGARMRKKYARR